MMLHYLHTRYNLEDTKLVSVLDDTSLWSYPPGYAILNCMSYTKGMHVLDIGFGTGFPLVEIAMRLGQSSKIYGIDPWKAGIERAKIKIDVGGVNNIEIIEGAAENMPFENNYFDLIVSNNGMNNVADLVKTLKECSRVCKSGGKFIFTFNTDKTFERFYSVYREVLRENDMRQYEQKISDHIYQKRKPVAEVKRLLGESGFAVNACDENRYQYRFADGTSMLNHFFIKLAFLEPWKNIVPDDQCERIFLQIEMKLNAKAVGDGGLRMEVPFVTMECEKR